MSTELVPPQAEPSAIRRIVARLLVRLLGRPVVCSTCGKPIFRAVAIPWRGGVRVVGAADAVVHVRFRTLDTIEFRHAFADECST